MSANAAQVIKPFLKLPESQQQNTVYSQLSTVRFANYPCTIISCLYLMAEAENSAIHRRVADKTSLCSNREISQVSSECII